MTRARVEPVQNWHGPTPSFAMIALTVIDVIVIALTWMEYAWLKRA